MSLFKQAAFLLCITQTSNIVRRYFVVNGFDGALTMLLAALSDFWLAHLLTFHWSSMYAWGLLSPLV